MSINVEKTVEEFKADFLAGNFKKDDLVNKSNNFSGEAEKCEFEQFVEFTKTELFEKIMQ